MSSVVKFPNRDYEPYCTLLLRTTNVLVWQRKKHTPLHDFKVSFVKNIDVGDTVRFALDTNLAFFLCLNREDVKPGVSMVRRVKEAMKKEIKQKETNVKNRQKTYKEQEKESREAALQNSISNQNKGFALLQKMGYKAGQGLGKEGK